MKKKRFAVRLLSAAMALTMCLGLGTAAAAATGDDVTEAAITKNLQMDENVTTPDATFKFTVTKVSLDESADAAELAKMPNITVPDIKFGSADKATTDSTTGLKEVKKQTANIIPAATSFPHAGVYKYTVAEVSDTYNAKTGETMTYSKAEFTMEILVVNDGDTLKIGGVYVNYVKGDDGNDKSGKVDPTPGTGDNVSAWEFVNKFEKNGSSDDPKDPDDPDDPRHESGALEIAKTVTGKMGDKTKKFNFTLTLNKLAALEPAGASYTATVHRADGTTETVTVNMNTPATFTLAHGEYLTFDKLPVGTKYTIAETEKNKDGYTTTVTSLVNSQAGSSEGENLVGEKANYVGYTNDKEGTVPTGIIVNNLPFVMLIVVAVCGFAGYIVFRRRRRIH